MLIPCVECGQKISNEALSCPGCGYPMASTKSTKKHRSLPNGFGQITKIKNRNLRKPYRAMVTVGKNQYGRPICQLLKPEAYFKTYNDAYIALVEYNKDPYDLSKSLTMKELYEKWSDHYFKSLSSESSKRTIISAWSYCASVYNVRAIDLRPRHIKNCMEHGETVIKGKKHTTTSNIKSRIKSMFNLMLDYAVEYEIVTKNYSRDFKLTANIKEERQSYKRSHIPFSESELTILWNHVNEVPYVDVILIQCYSGWRPQELGLIKTKDVDLENWTFHGGMKTKAGENRIVPIHPRIRELVSNRYQEAISLESEYLINCTDRIRNNSDLRLTYDKYKSRFIKIRNRLSLAPEHRPHDGRNSFITLAKKYKMDEYAIKYIVGHSITDITEKIYTQREVSWLTEEMKKIK